ncbi:M20/M25/M40 family metallo-hydrolase, partial [Leclercia adecarboxylata]|uniref:M20/M25/M40 family metallo-hydrolase n=1 Tax=Leclercia adecarboxylata TaxID=83655 RepID=UPI00234C6723
TLALCASLGMRTENFSGYAGHAEFGPEDAPEMVAMLGHLDVVPVGSEWTREPFGAEIEGDWLYARGASDDKGPTYAALFGAKAVLDSGLPLTRRIRLIFGCDEESGWECMRHYFEVAKQAKPDLAFTPDAGFPLCYAEKGSF